jgi:dTDP-4-dehydrorhamnose reductase
MKKSLILISGKNGQLGKELQNISTQFKNFEFIFFDRQELDIKDEASVKKAFEEYSPLYFINCAAYTAVDKAETEQPQAYIINAEAVGTIARCCYEFKTKLLHISTDYVFDGKGERPYEVDDVPSPVNYYGYTKWLGEQLALKNNPDTIIIRSSWIYSAYGNNFVKTMLRMMQEKKEISVVNDQFGSPTYARDLAEVVLGIVNRESSNVNEEKSQTSNIFHFSNDGTISWYDFAVAIKEVKQFDCIIHPIPTSSYPTPAKRPAYSALDKAKICETFNVHLKNWKESLQECLKLL